MRLAYAHPGMIYRLFYWNKRGRGEQIRLLLSELDLRWEDVFVGGEKFRQLQAEGPRALYFGSVPMLEHDGFRLCQGPVILSYLARTHGIAPSDLQAAARADAIALGAEDLRIEYFQLFGDGAATKQAEFVSGRWAERWLPCFEGLLELGGGRFFGGESPDHADIALWDVFDSITTWIAGASLDRSPRLAEHFAAIKARPRIAAYLASDRRPTG